MKPNLIGRVARVSAVVSCVLSPLAATAANDCSGVCTQTACSVDCTENDLRDAVAKANACDGVSGFSRTISFTCAPGSTINMQQTSPTAACPGDFEKYAVCLTGHDITIDAENKVTFNYSGGGLCASDQCGTVQPTLFTIKGHHNTVRNFTMQYFPEGIILRGATSSDNTVSGVSNSSICEDAITVHEGAGHTVSGNRLRGNTAAGPGHGCYKNDCQTAGPCGIDKAIQVNGGTSMIAGNVIDTIGTPVHVAGGTHTIANNSTTGSTSSQNVCFGYAVLPYPTGSVATVIVDGNTIRWCKWAVRVHDAAEVDASNNTATNSWLAAFVVRGVGNGKLRGAANQMYRNGHFAGSDCQRGALVARDNADARIDFGGGDYARQPVLGSLSPGGNRFCGQGSLKDVWNSTNSCTGASGASVGVRSNCFDSVPPEVQDPVPITTASESYAQCTAAECAFAGSGGPYIAAVNPAGAGRGAVTSSPAGIDCGPDCSARFAAGTVVTLAAVAEPGSSFVEFGGDADCGDGVLAMNADTICTATFDRTATPTTSTATTTSTTTTSSTTTTTRTTTTTTTSTTSTTTSTTLPPCLGTGALCSLASQCCSNQCVGAAGVKVCR